MNSRVSYSQILNAHPLIMKQSLLITMLKQALEKQKNVYSKKERPEYPGPSRFGQ